MKLKGYDNFFLVVDDLEKAKKYYKDILGLEIKFDFSDMGMVAFNIGNEEAAIILKEKNKFPDTKQTIWFIVDNVSEEYEKMKNKNVKLLTPPFPIRTGNAVEFEDPFGNRFGITDYKKG
ncbi:VOC family protein [Leptotrichia sp. OH3620_COT-345]|uniref:VOC family protein n=1 Tax=Leptotrichia sp. OH3620_COT-345 TaxID=2491048 RepID=UPI001F1E950C|nr:glyoxalase superfamily protein [Leptotrichia sp. OH3620_COT-345]